MHTCGLHNVDTKALVVKERQHCCENLGGEHLVYNCPTQEEAEQMLHVRVVHFQILNAECVQRSTLRGGKPGACFLKVYKVESTDLPSSCGQDCTKLSKVFLGHRTLHRMTHAAIRDCEMTCKGRLHSWMRQIK